MRPPLSDPGHGANGGYQQAGFLSGLPLQVLPDTPGLDKQQPSFQT